MTLFTIFQAYFLCAENGTSRIPVCIMVCINWYCLKKPVKYVDVGLLGLNTNLNLVHILVVPCMDVRVNKSDLDYSNMVRNYFRYIIYNNSYLLKS